MATAERLHYRGRIASLTRSRTPDDPELIDARRCLKAATLAEHIERVLRGTPPLTQTQRYELAALLQGGASE